jgi:hypothetical protein
MDAVEDPAVVQVSVDPTRIRNPYQLALVREFTQLAQSSPLSRESARRARHLMRTLLRYGIVTPVAATTAEASAAVEAGTEAAGG